MPDQKDFQEPVSRNRLPLPNMAARKLLDDVTSQLAQANTHYQRATELLTKLSDRFDLLEKECPICYDTIRDAVRTPCNHVYCATCIRDWLSRGKSVCPYCQQDIREADIVTADGEPIQAKTASNRPLPALASDRESIQSSTASNPRLPAPAAARNAFPMRRNALDFIGNPFPHYAPAQFTPGSAQYEAQQGLFNPHQASELTPNPALADPTPSPQNDRTMEWRQQALRRRGLAQEPQQEPFARLQPPGRAARRNTRGGDPLPGGLRRL